MADDKKKDRLRELYFRGEDLRKQGFFVPPAEECVDGMILQLVIDGEHSHFFWLEAEEPHEPCGGPYNVAKTCPPPENCL